MIPKEMKYNLLYGDVREDVPPSPRGTNTICSVVNKRQENCLWKQRAHYIEDSEIT